MAVTAAVPPYSLDVNTMAQVLLGADSVRRLAMSAHPGFDSLDSLAHQASTLTATSCMLSFLGPRFLVARLWMSLLGPS